jgi:PelA/Pel-15E family pectate lyase
MLGGAVSAGNDQAEDRRIAEMILLYQRDSGGWPKNYERSRRLSEEDIRKLRAEKKRDDSTFDNGATHSELRHLARAFNQTDDKKFKEGFLKGLDFVLAAQYENGGWPQNHPKPGGYHAHITFNDDAMIGIMQLLKAVVHDGKTYAFVDPRRRGRCEAAIRQGVQCILRCQVVVEGRKTAWCAQHDAGTLAPAKARSYELPSLSGSESVGIVKFLMEIEKPSPDVIDAIQGAITWFEEAKLEGIRLVKKSDPSAPGGHDRVVVNDPSAPSLWARFYRIGDNKPIFCSRDGVPKDTLAEISHERRNGYSWLGNRPASLLSKHYPEWRAKWASEPR